jgi:predicted kinase
VATRVPALIVFSGLPGTGKTTLAETTARDAAIPVFAVAWLLGALAPFSVVKKPDRGEVAYALLTMLVTRQLMLGQSAIVDGMVGSNAVRDRWRAIAREHRGRFVAIECVCSDSRVHRQRVEARREAIPGWPDPDWRHVETMRARYEPWLSEHLTVDAVDPLESNLGLVNRYISESVSVEPESGEIGGSVDGQ